MITLGIIGIVAKHRSMILKSKFQKSYSILSQALVRTAQELGQGLHVTYIVNSEGVGYDVISEFSQTFYKYLKIIGGGVGVKNSYNYVFAPYNPNKTDGDMLMGLGAYPGFVTLADGTAVSVLKNNGRLNVLVDINGMEKPNRSGYDVFLFVVDTKKDILTSWSGDKSRYCSKTSTNSYNGRACTYFAIIDESPDNPDKGYFQALNY